LFNLLSTLFWNLKKESIEIKSDVKDTNPVQTTPDPVAEIVTSTIKNHPRGYYKNGDSGPEIQEIQHALDAANFWTYNGFTNNFRGVTENAIIDFQRANGLKADGFVGVDTLNALASKKVAAPSVNYEPNEGPTKEVAPERLSAHGANVENTFIEGRAPWMKIVLDEAKNYGGHYENSDPLKSRIKNAYFTIANEYVNPTKSPANTSWCAAFASWVLQQTNFSNPSTCRAREFDPAYDWNGAKAGDRDSGMREIQEPVYGCIVVWRSNSGGGHVGFYYGKTAENKIVVIGGNQGNSLKFSQRHPNGDYGQKVVGYFLPENYTDNSKDAFTAADLNLNVVEMNKSSLLNKFAETDSSKT